MSDFTLNATLRSQEEQGKGASRRLRRQNLIPAIIYGGNSEPKSINLKANELSKALQSESFFASLINIDVAGETEEVIIKDLQRHPAKGFAMHADFQRVVRGQTMNFNVPVHFVGEAAGVKDGGILSTNITDVEITCLPRELPEFIEVDVSALAIGDVLRLSDIKLQNGSITQLDSDGADRVIVSVQPPVVEEEPEETPSEEETPLFGEATDGEDGDTENKSDDDNA